MPLPFESEPFYIRPFLLVGSILGGLFTVLVSFVIPIAVAIAIIFGIGIVGFAILAAVFGWEPASGETKAKREKVKERDQKQNEKKLEPGLSTSLPATTSDSNGTVDLEERLEIEIELLREMVVARKERLEALKKTHLGYGTSYLEVLEKVE